MTASDLVDAGSCQGTTVAGNEDRTVGCTQLSLLLEELFEKRSGLCPKGAGPPFVALAMKANTRLVAKVQIRHTKLSHLLHTGACVIEEQEQHTVSQG